MDLPGVRSCATPVADIGRRSFSRRRRRGLRRGARHRAPSPTVRDDVNPLVRNLANLMQLKHRSGEKYVLMLGAGASMSSGVKRTPDIMEELLGKYGQDLNGAGRVEDRFDRLWQ